MLSKGNVRYCVDTFLQKTGATVDAPDERVELYRATVLRWSFKGTIRRSSTVGFWGRTRQASQVPGLMPDWRSPVIGFVGLERGYR